MPPIGMRAAGAAEARRLASAEKEQRGDYAMSSAMLNPVPKLNKKTIRLVVGMLAAIGLPSVGTAAHAQDVFSLIGSLTVPRLLVNGPAAVAPLPNGGVLIAGSSGHSTAEVYNASLGTFTAVDMGEPYQAATLMQNGAVLLSCSGVNDGSGTSPAALYNPQTGALFRTGDMPTVVSACTGTLLGGGGVLLAGGMNGAGAPSNSAAIYDPASGTFSATGALANGRYGHTATLLKDGTVLLAGGTQYNAGYGPSLSSAELYDPSTGQFTGTGSLGSPRAYAAAALLPDGRVLVSGGEATFNDNSTQPVQFWNTAEIYDPASGTFSATGTMTTARTRHSAAPLANGQVLIAGGLTSTTSANATASAEIYDPASGSFSATGSMSTGRSFLAAVPLTNGLVLVAGGLDGGTILNSAEIYAPAISTARKDSPRGSKNVLASLSPEPRLMALTLAAGFAGFIW
jgi:hypothetical protein